MSARSLPKAILSLIVGILAAPTQGVAEAGDPERPLAVFALGGSDAPLRGALSHAPAGSLSFVEDPGRADLVLVEASPDASARAAIAEARARGAGLLVAVAAGADSPWLLELLGAEVSIERRSDPASLVASPGSAPPSGGRRGVGDIVWSGSPQVRERAGLVLSKEAAARAGLRPLVETWGTGECLLWEAGGGRIFLVSFDLSAPGNGPFREWGYFGYLVFSLAASAAGREPPSFADWPASPVPHSADVAGLAALLALVASSTFALFLVQRRRSLRRPEALDRLVLDRARYEKAEDGTPWERAGFHRALGGFFVTLTMGLVMFIPLIIYQNLILPNYILPSAQALGLWGRVTQFFQLAWQIFDMGTAVAFVKFFSEYRVKEPRRAIQFGQLFVWWQAVTGVLQIGVFVVLAASLAPRSAFALYSWLVVAHALIQVPGCFLVFRHAFNASQRNDHARLLDVAQQLVLPMVTQPLFVTIFFVWGRAHPSFGGPMAGAVGMGAAAYAGDLAVFALGYFLYRRTGLDPRPLFMAHFDRGVVKEALGFGVFEMLGSAAWAAGQAIEIWITQSRLANYAEIWGNWIMAQNFIFAFNVTQTLFEGAMPAISEALARGKRELARYYAAMMYKYGGMVHAFVGAVLLAVADRFIIGSTGRDFERAAVYVRPLIVWGAIQYGSWVGDWVQHGAGKPWLKAGLVGAEQVVRILLALLLLGPLQVNGLIVAYFVGLAAKGLAAYFVNDRLCYRQTFYAWQSAVAPLLAGAAHYAILRLLGDLVWKGDALTSILIFFVGILPSFPLFAFLYALAGGWDREGIEELKLAVDLAGSVRGLARILVYAPSALGARISPLTGRFPVRIRAAALEEAAQIDRERVKLE